MCSILLISLPSTAQIVSGGGTIDWKIDRMIDRHQEGGIIGPDPFETQILAYTNGLKLRERSCSKSPKIDDTDLMQVYLKLSLEKFNIFGHLDCNAISDYFNCLNTSQNKKLFKELKKNHNFSNVLQLKYSLTKKEADKIISFFDLLDQTKN